MSSLSKLIVTAAAGIGLFLGVLFFLILPALDRVSALSETLKQKKTDLLTLEQQILAFQNAQTDLSKASEQEVILGTIVKREELVEAVKSLEAAASNTGTEHELKIIDTLLNPLPKGQTLPPPVIKGKVGIEEIPYRVVALSDYIGTVNFVRYLEHLPQFTELTKFTLSAELSQASTGSAPVRTGRVLGSIDGVFFVQEK